MKLIRNHAHQGRRLPGNVGVSSGFTLIELMVTVAIVGILIAIALPSYQFAMTKTRRGAAKGCLQEDAQFMERFHTTNMKYDTAVLPACSSDVTPYYTVGFAAGQPTASTFIVQAVPIAATQPDSTCGTMSIDQVGTKKAGDNSAATIATCW